MYLLLPDKLLQTLTWSFIHSLWQGLVLAIIAGLVMFFTAKAAPAIRYKLLSLLFFVFQGSFVVTFFIEWNIPQNLCPVLTGIQPAPGMAAFFTYSNIQPALENAVTFLNANASWIILTWLLMLIVRLGGMLHAINHTSRLRHYKTCVPGNYWRHKLAAYCQDFGITKPVLLLESAIIKIPVVAGHFKPVILVPAGALLQLPPGEVEAVLLHELAHIKRNDYRMNFIQQVTELFFFFNPGLLWISSLLHTERENCCDDMAIAKTGNKAVFVEALIRFKEYALLQPAYTIAFPGKKHLLLQRVSRIVYNRNKTLTMAERVFLIVSVFALILLAPVTTKRTVALPVSDTRLTAAPVNKETVPYQIPTKVVPAQLLTGTPAPQTAKGYTRQKKSAGKVIKAASTSAYIKQQKQAAVFNKLSEEKATAIQAGQQLTKITAAQKQAEINKLQAEQYRKEAELLRQQADKHRAEAMQKRQEAEKNRIQADRYRQDAEINKQYAEEQRKLANAYLQEAAINKKYAEENRGKNRQNNSTLTGKYTF